MKSHLPRAQGESTHRQQCQRSRPGGKPKLLEQVRELLRAKYYVRRTEEAYLGWIRRFILFSGKRHPKEMGGAEGWTGS